MCPEETELWIQAINEKRKREDQLVARLGYFLYTSQGAKKSGGGPWRERDFLPQPPPSRKQLEIIHKIEEMKLEAISKKREGRKWQPVQ